MIFKKFLTSFCSFFLLVNVSQADEGMWMLHLLKSLNEKDMKRLGLNLSAEEIYSDSTSSLKDAIVNFGGFCTGSVISKDGLVLTNHHCGYSSVQSHSTDENNYLTKGFWALSKDQELPNEDLTVSFLVRMREVTPIIETALEGIPDDKRYKVFSEVTDSIIKAETKDTHYDAKIKQFYSGNQYFLFVFETFRDIRLVGAPPESIGKYGGDTDNWMWPRHTADFTLFRIYTGPDGKPAEYSDKNIPLKPKHYLPVSTKGVKEKDFSMVLGFPGGTDRFMTSQGIENIKDRLHPAGIKIRERRLNIMKSFMKKSPTVQRQYSSKYARVSNYHKNWIGQIESFNKLRIVDFKRKEEAEYKEWANETPERREKYGEVLDNIAKLYPKVNKVDLVNRYINEAAFGPEIMEFAYTMEDLILTEAKSASEKEEKALKIKKAIDNHFKNYHRPIDELVFADLMEIYYKDMPKPLHPATFAVVEKKYKRNFRKWAKVAFEKSVFSSKEKIEEFLLNFDVKKLQKDPVFMTMESTIDNYRKFMRTNYEDKRNLKKEMKKYVAGLMEIKEGQPIYPDANFTMRLTYGSVMDYSPKDAVTFDYKTTLKGVMEKEDPNNPEEFFVETKLKELYASKDYGPYGVDETMPVCFTSNNDITGGNSGSPVIGANGELIGLAFDGNWEAMSSDYVFEPNLQRCINVDIRYVLFIIDKFAGAKNLVDEMTLVK